MPVIRQVTVKGSTPASGFTLGATGLVDAGQYQGGMSSLDVPADATEEQLGGEGIELAGEERTPDNNYGLATLGDLGDPTLKNDGYNLTNPLDNLLLADQIKMFGNQTDPFDLSLGSTFPNQVIPRLFTNQDNDYANNMSQVAGNIAAAGLNPSGRAAATGPGFDPTFDPNLPGGGTVAADPPVKSGPIDMSPQGTGDDARDPNVIIDDAARDGTTIDDLIGTYKDPDGNPYSIASVIGALILSNNPNAATVLSNSGYNPDGSPAGTPDPGPGTDPGPGADPGTGPSSSQPPAADPPAADPPAGDPPAGDPPAGDPPVSDIPDDDKPEGGIGLPSLPELATGAATAAGIGGAMSAFSNAFSNTTKESQTMDPDIKNRLTDLYGPAPGVMNSLVNRLNTSYPGYGGDRFNDQNPDQLRFNEMVRSNIARAPGADIFESGVDRANATTTPTGASVANEAFGPTGLPLQKAARSNIQDVVAGQFAGTNLDPYQNPYQNLVIDAALGDLNRATDMRLQTADDQATKAGAYGGDRASIERGLIGEESLRTAGRMVADLRARGFEDAANRVEADLDRQLKAQQDNQRADTQTVQDALTTATAVSRDDPVNQLNASQALIDAFSTGSDQYRNYLADFMGVGDRLDARDQREKDFDFEQFAAAFGYDQNMIENMINLLKTAQGTGQKESSTEMGSIGQLAQIAELAPMLGPMFNTGADLIGGLFNRREKSARDEYIDGVGKT